jgi:hypothetical protein
MLESQQAQPGVGTHAPRSLPRPKGGNSSERHQKKWWAVQGSNL